MVLEFKRVDQDSPYDLVAEGQTQDGRPFIATISSPSYFNNDLWMWHVEISGQIKSGQDEDPITMASSAFLDLINLR